MHRIRRFQVPRTSHRSAGFVNAILELSIPEVRFLRRYSVENRLSHKTFGVHNLVNLANDRFRLFLWDDDYAVDIGKDKVTGPDLDALDLNRLAKGFERPGAGDVPWCLEPCKYGEIQLSDKRIITAPAVDDVTPYAAEMQGFGGEFAHQSEVVILRLANNDMSFRRNAQEFSPSQYTLVHAAVRIRPSLHCEHAPC